MYLPILFGIASHHKIAEVCASEGILTDMG